MSLRWICLASLALAACGGEAESLPPRMAEPIGLGALDRSPGCFVERSAARPTDAVRQMLEGTRQMAEYQGEVYLALAERLAEPIRAAPFASRWAAERDGGRVEGEVVARGAGWSMIAMVEISAEGSNFATIEVTPARTRFDFGDHDVEFGDDFVRVDARKWGCDPKTGLSFELSQTPTFVDGRIERVDEVTCWPETDGLRCLEAIESVLSR